MADPGPTTGTRGETLTETVKRPLIVNADDLGLAQSVNEAVFELHDRGIVTSATLLANGTDFLQAVSLAARRPELGIGLHFNITLGRPLAPAARVRNLLDPDGAFLSRRQVEFRALLGGIDTEAVSVELEAQFNRLLAEGIKPTHLDSHQHVHVVPGVWKAVAGFARKHGLPVRCPRPGPMLERPSGRRGVLSLHRFRRTVLGQVLSRHWPSHSQGIRSTGSFTTVFDLQPAPPPLSPEDYYALLGPDRLAGSVELMVHLVKDASAVSRSIRIGDIAELEYRSLRAADPGRLFGGQGFSPASFKDLIALAVDNTKEPLL